MSGSQQLLLGGSQAAAIDPFFYSVTSLLHGDGTNGAQNNTFLDSSTNNFTITRNGNTTQGSFSPFSQTGWGNFFNSGAIIRAGSSANLTLGSGSFTCECWVFPTAFTTTYAALWDFRNGANFQAAAPLIWVGTDGKVNYQNASIASSSSLALNQWTHVAVVRNGTTVTMYFNGTSVGSVTDSTTMTNTYCAIGATNDTSTTYYLSGYVSNSRVVVGSAVYTANFTPPTAPLTAISGTAFLTCQSNRFADNSANALTIAIGQSPSVQPFSPFNPTTAYSTSAVGGSGYFDGSGDWVEAPANAAFNFGTGDFTVEAWVYPTSTSGTRPIVEIRTSAANSTGFAFLSQSGATTLNVYTNGGFAGASTASITTNAWNHVALVRSGNTWTYYINGASAGSFTNSSTQSDGATTGPKIGGSTTAGEVWVGYMGSVRILKGTAQYTGATYTIPTAPLTAITNTSLLLNFTNAGIFDNAADADYETVGNAQISTSVKKYGTGSMAFDGSGDYLKTPVTTNLDFGTGDFTIEMWVYFNNTTDSGGLGVGLITNPTGTYSTIYSSTNNGTTLTFYNGSAIVSGTISLSNWIHVAVSRSAGVVKMFINGNQTGSASHTSAVSFSGAFVGSQTASGGYLNGYIDDLRISKGVARYTYSFTPPTAEFPNIGGTVTLTADPYFDYTTLLLPGNGTNGAQNNTFLDSSTNNFTITRNGNTTQGTFSPFSQTGWGNYFDGSGDYLTAPDNAAFDFGSGDFTIELWFYPTTVSGFQGFCGKRANSPSYGPLSPGINNGAVWLLFSTSGSSWAVNTTGGTLVANQWYHVAIVRSGTSLKAYLNGTEIISTTLSGALVSNSVAFSVGSMAADGGDPFSGYISNFRAIKGTAVYTANFTPSTTPLTAITNTSLLTCQSNRFVDNSSNAFAITRNGDVSVQAFSPFNPTAAWSAATNGGSGYFDGSGDYLDASASAALGGSGNFTLQMWIYPTTVSGDCCIYETRSPTGWVFFINSTGYLQVYDSTALLQTASTTQLKPYQWTHVALVKNGSTCTYYVNGSAAGTFTLSTFAAASRTRVGSREDATASYFGWISNLKTDTTNLTITLPTAPLTAGANTNYLLNFTNAGIYDATSKNDLETVGNAQISTTQSKFGGSSMYFDGTGDYLSIPATQNIVFGTADFTIEMWVYSGSQGSTGARMFGNGAGAAWGSGKYILTTTTAANPNKFTLGINNASPADVLVSTTTFNDSTWRHVAITRYDGVFRLFVNGILESTNTTNVSVDNGTAAQIRIGSSGISGDADWAGYIDDLRITKGIARYTSNFTPPTTAFLTL